MPCGSRASALKLPYLLSHIAIASGRVYRAAQGRCLLQDRGQTASTFGPQHRYGALLFIEKEGFSELVAFIERKLTALKIGKVVPDAATLGAACEHARTMAMASRRKLEAHDGARRPRAWSPDRRSPWSRRVANPYAGPAITGGEASGPRYGYPAVNGSAPLAVRGPEPPKRGGEGEEAEGEVRPVA